MGVTWQQVDDYLPILELHKSRLKCFTRNTYLVLYVTQVHPQISL